MLPAAIKIHSTKSDNQNIGALLYQVCNGMSHKHLIYVTYTKQNLHDSKTLQKKFNPLTPEVHQNNKKFDSCHTVSYREHTKLDLNKFLCQEIIAVLCKNHTGHIIHCTGLKQDLDGKAIETNTHDDVHNASFCLYKKNMFYTS